MKYTLELSQQDVQVLIQGLGELPLKVAANTFAVVQSQVKQQDDASAVDLQTLQQQVKGEQNA